MVWAGSYSQGVFFFFFEALYSIFSQLLLEPLYFPFWTAVRPFLNVRTSSFSSSMYHSVPPLSPLFRSMIDPFLVYLFEV